MSLAYEKFPRPDPQLGHFAGEGACDGPFLAEDLPPVSGFAEAFRCVPTGSWRSSAHNDVMVDHDEPEPGQHADSAPTHPHPMWAGLSRGGARRVVELETEWVPARLRPTGPENRCRSRPPWWSPSRCRSAWPPVSACTRVGCCRCSRFRCWRC